MFGKFMNNYYYGKSGKGDYTPEDLPKNRWQLFMEMLRVRLSALCRMNLIYMLAWLPMMMVVANFFINSVETLNMPVSMESVHNAVVAARNAGTGIGEDGSVTITDEDGNATTYDAAAIQTIESFMALSDEEVVTMQVEYVQNNLLWCLIWLIPCIFITGPWTAGVSYVTRNWSRDEHAFIWSDMKDAMKENWKPALVLSGITSVLPLVVYLCWTFYGSMANDSLLMIVPQMLTLMMGLLWSIAVTYMYPMLVTYKMNLRTIFRNSFLLAIGRLPLSVGVRLLHCLPLALATVLMLLTGSLYVPLALFAYYLLIGFTLSRFVTASYTNAQFDKFINSRIEGAQVNRGLSEEDDDDWDDDEEDEERELKPWENGYTNRE
ncbi:MAG: DUF624 domain-containing protein [Clostridia bacterium]|nr:DUF624 domain-containing protein [Clostridia bacterium]